MKVAMWKADKSGHFCFSDGVDPSQLTLFKDDPAPKLADVLSRNFSGETVYSEAVLEYGRDHTAYLDEHTRAALKLLEESSRITVADRKRDGKPRKKRTYPEGARIHLFAIDWSMSEHSAIEWTDATLNPVTGV
jgi:hypothetical protein